MVKSSREVYFPRQNGEFFGCGLQLKDKWTTCTNFCFHFPCTQNLAAVGLKQKAALKHNPSGLSQLQVECPSRLSSGLFETRRVIFLQRLRFDRVGSLTEPDWSEQTNMAKLGLDPEIPTLAGFYLINFPIVLRFFLYFAPIFFKLN